MIVYEDCGVKLTIPYHIKDLDGGVFPQLGDKVLWTSYPNVALFVCRFFCMYTSAQLWTYSVLNTLITRCHCYNAFKTFPVALTQNPNVDFY